MVLRESTPWRWSHTRHHTDTIIVGRDPEIAVPRPPDIWGIILGFFSLKSGPKEYKKILLHCFGRLTPEEKTYIPEAEYGRVFWTARIWALIYAATVAWAVAMHSILPLMLIGLPSFYGAWLLVIFGLTQHAGLAEDVLDHRLNCRTVYMNPVFRFVYWNMNYHLEHHMFPMVPYHALPALHAEIKADTPKPYRSLIEAYREIIPALLRQVKDPAYYVKRELPPLAKPFPTSLPLPQAAQ
jgi:fatty acid desaturase